MTPRQKRNLTLARTRRMENAAAHIERCAALWAELQRIAEQAAQGHTIASHPEWYGHPPQGVTVN